MSAAARDQRTSPAVASARISELEKHLGVRLFNRTTRSLQPTENGTLFYDGARKVLDAIDEAEAAVMEWRKTRAARSSSRPPWASGGASSRRMCRPSRTSIPRSTCACACRTG